SVNTSLTGTYILTYRYVDTAGNTGSTTRIVSVISAVAIPPVVIPPTPPVQTQTVGGGGAAGSYGSYNSPSVNFNSAPSSESSNSNNRRNLVLGIARLMQILGKNTENREIEETKNIEILDIKQTELKDIVTSFIEKGFIPETSYFEPTKNMTRAEFIKIVSLANGFVEKSGTKTPNLKAQYNKYIIYAMNNKWINPIISGFRPNDSITLSEAKKIMAAFEGKSTQNIKMTEGVKITRAQAISMIAQKVQ
ncbi:DUF5011 domain-containing protein, partial [Candidatus Gracilibacteria bacterium]|nr:DUF5011 domain-containing protein [Candidatus Gracilibacteria bacterium]